MSLDFNDAPSQQSGDFELLPVGTMVKLYMTIRPGNDSTDPMLTASNSSDAKYMDCEFAISSAPFRGRKVWQNMTVSGGKVDEQGRSKGGMITAGTLRAIINSARNINPEDDGDQARANRVLGGYADFTGMEFAAKIGKENGKNGYADKNKIAVVIEPGHADYAKIMAGETITPVGATGGASKSPGAPSTPSWAATTPAPAVAEQAPVAATNGQKPAVPAAQAAPASGVPAWAQ